MGCLKLTYQTSESPLKVVYRANGEFEKPVQRFISLDPIPHYYQSPYCGMDNNPIMYVDPDGTTVNGDYYGKNGKYLGSDGKNDDKVYRVDNARYKTTTIKGTSPTTGRTAVLKWKKELDIKNSKSTELSIKHSEFIKQAATVYGESSYTYGILSKEEMFAIASVHQKNGIAYGADNDGANQYKSTNKYSQNEGMQTANAAVMNAVTGGFDYSYGADQWDGAEQSMVPQANMDKASNGRFMYKMNTMGWSISDTHYASWKKAVESEFGAGKFTVPQKKVATQNYGGMENKGKIRLKSTAQHGLTIFWKTN